MLHFRIFLACIVKTYYYTGSVIAEMKFNYEFIIIYTQKVIEVAYTQEKNEYNQHLYQCTSLLHHNNIT